VNPLPAAADPHRQRVAWETFLTEALRATEGGEHWNDPAREELVGMLRGGKADDEGELAARPYTIGSLLVSAEDPAPFAAYRRVSATGSEAGLFTLLRTEVDAIMVGAGTLRRGRYERRLCQPGLRDRRLANGLTRDPLGVVVSRSGHPPMDAPMFSESECEVAVFTSAPEPPPPCSAHVHLSRMSAGDLTPRVVLARLRQEFGVRALLYEGGPTMLGALAQDGLLDEAFITADGSADAAAALAGIAEPDPLWDRTVGATRLVRFRAQRSD
jgi:riboflavin biosynthesis pyrimidine reductase